MLKLKEDSIEEIRKKRETYRGWDDDKLIEMFVKNKCTYNKAMLRTNAIFCSLLPIGFTILSIALNILPKNNICKTNMLLKHSIFEISMLLENSIFDGLFASIFMFILLILAALSIILLPKFAFEGEMEVLLMELELKARERKK